MGKVLMIRGSEPKMMKQTYLFSAMQSEIFKKYEVYVSESISETVYLLEKHSFQAVLSTALTAQSDKGLYNLLDKHTRNGGTLILSSRRLGNLAQAALAKSPPLLIGNFELKGHHIHSTRCYYVLNPKFENVFGPSVFASLERTICTSLQLLGRFPDSTRIYQSAFDSGCAAAFGTHGKGFIGCLGDIPEQPAMRTLLLAMLGRLRIIGRFSRSDILMPC